MKLNAVQMQKNITLNDLQTHETKPSYFIVDNLQMPYL